MTFANPAGNAVAAAEGYVRALLELLGDRDPLAVATELVPWLERRTAGVPDDVLRRPEAPGKWSTIEVIQHLADTELVIGWRTRIVLTEERPVIQGYDQDAWARTLGYRAVPLAMALDQLRGIRLANLRLWHSLTAAQRERSGCTASGGRRAST